jgi:ATP-binding cassette subfamily B multidrug efflux pump
VRFVPRELLLTTLSKGYLINISTSEIGMARMLFGFILVGAFDLVFLGCLTITSMLLIDPVYTLIALMVYIPMPFLIKKLSDKELGYYEKAQDYLGEFNQVVAQAISTIRLQRVSTAGVFWTKRLFGFAQNYRNKRLDAAKTSFKFIPLMGFFTLLTYTVLFSFCLQRYFEGKMSIGDFLALQGLVFLLQDPLLEMGFVISDWKRGMTSLRRFLEVVQTPVEPVFNHRQLPQFTTVKEKLLEVRNFSLVREDGSPLVHLPQLNIKPGDRIGITGEVGSGKTLFLESLAGLRWNYQGVLLYKGQPVQEIPRAFLGKKIGHVAQKPFLFATSIRENVTLDYQLDDQELWHYLELAGIGEDIRQMPDGLDTPLGEWGINLSGGQKQRLTLARALARRPEILLLDDALSAVDTQTEERILRGFEENFKQTAILWVAHRRSTLRHCDQLLEFGKS